jgi:rhamnogalacturonan endolyase
MNFRIYWDGDLQEELFDGGKIDDWNGNGTSRLYINGKNPYDYNSSSTCNGSKSTPNLQADIFGDWREEIILWNSSEGNILNIFSSAETTKYAVPTLMHDNHYRLAIAWQNVAYNQPPHLGYYLPDRFLPSIRLVDEALVEQTIELGDSITPILTKYRYASVASVDSTYTPNGLIKGLPEGFERTMDYTAKSMTISGTPAVAGDYTFVLRVTDPSDSKKKYYTYVTVHVVDPAGIDVVEKDMKDADASVFDLQGRKVATLQQLEKGKSLQRGIYIVDGKKLFIE